MKNDSVTTAFEIILEEIDSVVTEVNLQGAAFLTNNEYPKAKASMEVGTKLNAFHQKLELLKKEWLSGLDETTRRQVNVETSAATKTIVSGSKAPKTVLVVKFDDGTVLSGGNAAETFSKALKKFGFQRVIELDEKVNYLSLVSKQRLGKYHQTEIDGYHVSTHSSTDDKRDKLLKIAAALREIITVDIVPV
ncbi:MAG: hypothetical protein Q7T07_13045 [Burkholderiaceae bacterium]|nr:hypothetical protein [Burkholderiaceae bacterium]